MKLKKQLGIGLITVLTMTASVGNVFAASMPGATPQSTVTISSPASDLRVALDKLLGEHANLAIIAMQKGYNGSADFSASAAALSKNTDALSAAIASVYGDAAGAQFKDIWSKHIGFFVDYVTATVKNDSAAKQVALDKLDQYRKDFSTFLASANPNIDPSQIADGLQMHVNELVGAFNAYVNKDYTTESADLLESYNHMFETGNLLAAAIVKQFPDKFSGATSNQAVDLRVALDQLLGEHANLAVLAMQKGIDGAPDFGAVVNALSQNTDQLSAAITSVYGKAAGVQFKDMWSRHIGFFVDYVVATSKNDAAGKQAALSKLDQYRSDFSKFLGSANPNIDPTVISNGLQMHVNQLVSAFDSYVAKDYTTTYSSYDMAYGHMFETGDLLAGAIVTQYPDRFDNNPTTTPASDLRATLDRLLGEHANLAIIAMQKGYNGSADFGAAAAALSKNTDALSAAITSVYGEAAGAQFKDIWSKHIGFFVDYVTATVKNDAAGKQAALDKLDQYRKDFSTFLASANPNIDPSQIADGLQMHVNELVGAFNAYVNKDYTTESAQLLESYNHMYATGALLAAAIVKQSPAKYDNSVTDSGAANLRIALDQLLGEHANLAVLAMQKGIEGAPDFNAVASALSQNTDQLSAAISSVYGTAAGDQFKDMWSRHIGFFVDYVVATAKNDTAGKQTALSKLDQYRSDFSKFLGSANPNIDPTVIANGLQMHVNQLISAFDSYVAKDYATTYSSYDTAYNHMFETGDLLAGAITTQFPTKFPVGKMPSVVGVLKVGSKDFVVNGNVIPFDVAPFIQGDRTFVSLRALSEAVGATVTWNGDNQMVTVKSGSDTAIFWIGKDYMEFNGMQKPIGTALFIQNSRTQIPLRFIAEPLGWQVDWNQTDGSVTLSK